jgi:hypothetical protein
VLVLSPALYLCDAVSVLLLRLAPAALGVLVVAVQLLSAGLCHS